MTDLQKSTRHLATFVLRIMSVFQIGMVQGISGKLSFRSFGGFQSKILRSFYNWSNETILPIVLSVSNYSGNSLVCKTKPLTDSNSAWCLDWQTSYPRDIWCSDLALLWNLELINFSSHCQDTSDCGWHPSTSEPHKDNFVIHVWRKIILENLNPRQGAILLISRLIRNSWLDIDKY